jgi:pimeloyl-ACP methyl ester carboxylesterase
MAGDLPVDRTAVLAASQRPVSLTAFSDKSAYAAWHTIPSWAIVPTEDKAIGPANERVMAQRAGARIVEVEASHLVLVSHPEDVARLIETAASAGTDTRVPVLEQ